MQHFIFKPNIGEGNENGSWTSCRLLALAHSIYEVTTVSTKVQAQIFEYINCVSYIFVCSLGYSFYD